MKRMYIQPATKIICLKCKVALMEPSISNFGDQRPSNGNTNGKYASDGYDYGDTRSRIWDDLDNEDDE